MIYDNDISNDTVTAFKDASPIIAGYLTVSFVFGLMCINQGLPFWLPTLMSLLVYAGASQFSFLVLVSGGASIGTIILTTFLINLRHMLMSIYMSDIFDKKYHNHRFRWMYGFGLTDEAFAYHSSSMKDTIVSKKYLVSFNIFCHSSWVLGSLLGSIAGFYAADIITINLEYALTAMMLSVLVSLIDNYEKLLISVSSILVMSVLTLFFDSYINIFIATFIGCWVGLCLKKKYS